MNKKIHRYKRFWLLLLVVAYLLVGFFYVPKIIKQQLQQQISEQLDMQADLTAVKFNPITFTTELHDLALTDANQETWFSSSETSIDFDPLNLLWGEWKFSDLKLVQPNITLLTDADGQVIIPALPEFPVSEESDESIDFSIDDIHLVQGRMNLQAGNIKKDFALNIKSIEFRHEKFSLTDEDTRFNVKITTEQDESIELDGHYNHKQQFIQSNIVLAAWQATTLNQILPNELKINNQNGLIDASAEINWLLNKNPQLNFTEVKISNLNTNWQNEIGINDFSAIITGAAVDTEKQLIEIESISSEQANWQLNWPLSQPSESNLEEAPDTSDDSAQWQVKVNLIDIKNWPVEIIDNELQANLHLNIDSLGINSVNNGSDSFMASSKIRFAEAGMLTISSEQRLVPFAFNADFDIDDFTLQQLAPWITAQSGLVLTQGKLKTSQEITLNEEYFTLIGNLSISEAVIKNQAGQDIADIGELMIGATSISSQEKSITVDQISLDRANGNIIIDAEKNINIQNLKPQVDTAEHQPEEPSEWVIKVGAINIKDTSTALIDQSVEPTVSTKITELNGQIKGLSSESLSKADVNISGKFNQFSPLSIQGKINPLSSDAYTDLKVVIEDLDLLAFSPYSASYVAFPINGGKLNLELDYSLNQHELIGKNNMLFKQLKFGNKTDSPDAVQLPLKLAVSLLSDGKGEMKIDLPVSGNIDDPEFSYGGLIGKALFKLITGIVASPFKLLGKLIPNPDPNLSDIQFNPGSAELIESEKNKLNQIAEIMAKKTELNLQLNPHIDSSFDEQELKQIMLLQTAPFAEFDVSNEQVMQWLEAQISAEKLATYANETAYDHNKMWQDLVQKQVISPEQFQALTDARNLSIKNYLLESAGIAAEKVFVEQAQAAENNQAMIKIGVSR